MGASWLKAAADPVRVGLWNRDGSARLESDRGCPEVRVPAGCASEPAAVVSAVRDRLELGVAFMRVATGRAVELEVLDPGQEPPAGLGWRPRQLDPSLEVRAPWQRPGWLRETVRAVDRALADRSLRRTADPVQVRHTSVTGMLRIPTSAGVLWLKAVPPLFAHEGAVVEWLGRVAPRAVPSVVARTPEWWLSQSFPEPAAPCGGDFLVTMARLQLASVGYVDELRAAGCRDRPLEVLPEEVNAAARRDDLLAGPDRAALAGAVTGLRDVCTSLAALGFPATLVHGDLHPDNVRWTKHGWFLFDWTDACIGHPLVEVALPLLYDGPVPAGERLAAFGAVWDASVGAAAVERGLLHAHTVGAAHQLVSYRAMVDEIECSGGDEANRDDSLRWLRFWARQLVRSLAGGRG